jgi:hypothetical protein
MLRVPHHISRRRVPRYPPFSSIFFARWKGGREVG